MCLEIVTNGGIIRETIIPIVPAWGDGIPAAYRIRQVPNAKTDAEIAAHLFVFFQNNPQIKGPRKTEPIAPQEMPKMATMVAGLK